MSRAAHDAVAELVGLAEDARDATATSNFDRGYQSGRVTALRTALRAVDATRYTVRALAPFAAGWNTIDTWTGESPSHHRTEDEATDAAAQLNLDHSNPRCRTCRHRDTSHDTGPSRGCYECPDSGSACGRFVPDVAAEDES